MTSAVEQMSAELRDELASNDHRAKVVDPRKQPVRFSNLRAMAQSALHAYQSFQDDKDESLARRLGKGVHAILLGQPVVLFDKPAKKGKGKAPRNGEVWDDFKAEHRGKTILIRKEWDRAMRVADAIRSNEHAEMLLLSPGVKHEETILWEMDGRARRSTPDARLSWVTELKTTRCAAPFRFKRDCRSMAYHAQVADQCMAVEAATGRRPRDAYIAAVETVPPFAVQVYRLTPQDLSLGERLVRSWLGAYLQAEKRAGERSAERAAWIGYSSGVLDMELPEDDFDVLPVTEDEPEEEAAADSPF